MQKTNKEVSSHYKKRRYRRESLIKNYLHGDGKIVDSFIIDKGHPMGLERHDITEHGVIIIHNVHSNILVSKLIARPAQIKRYYLNVGREPPSYLVDIARQHQFMGYNKD